MRKPTFLFALFFIGSQICIKAQVTNSIELPTIINDTGTTVSGPDNSAILELMSGERGMLVPRMRQVQRDAIANPAQSLLIFQTDGDSGFYYYDDNNWVQLSAGTRDHIQDADADTRVHTEESPDEDLIRFDVGGTERMRLQDDELRLSSSTEMYFDAGFSGSPGDKISLNGNTLDAISMTGLGYEVSTYVDGQGNIFNLDNLYYKAEGAHSWYTNVLADGGLGASSMVLDRFGNLGIGTHTPETPLDVAGVVRSSSTVPEIELYDDASTENRVEGSFREASNIIYLESYWGDLRLRTGNAGTASTRMTIDAATGNVGIGTTNPAEKLHITGGTDVTLATGGYVQLGSSTGLNLGIDNNEIQARDNGAVGTLTLQNGGGDLNVRGRTTIDADFRLQSPNNSTFTLRTEDDGDLKFVGDGVIRMLIRDNNGAVGIGVASASEIPSGYLLAVGGSVISEEVRVDLMGSWPDYVFQDDYQLRSIEELEQSIQENGHLPGIPSAYEVENDGLHLGDMQKRMMEKIEELSLYIIQLNEENKALKTEMEGIKKEIRN